ncbi:flagellar hook-length control protein FliK [Kosakonia pseudosacchari]|uniref:flagellar hook-length control protein FliK n=1 Tax=Kosakonia pseudosacchari TaxID=1646340 RepID=UPI00187FD119|nr:flagellar hook-length control protein FliK [Kosakonia pseudosacchari]QOV63019.1 flagellar hook-length control protein FliK [Kosakonia pseudosacchari]
MIIRPSNPAPASDSGRQTASTSSVQEEGEFSSALKKQLAAEQPAKTDKKAPAQEGNKKPADKKEEPSDDARPTPSATLAIDPLAQVAKTIALPAEVTTADALLAQGEQAAQPALADLAALPQNAIEPALAATPANALTPAAVATDVQPTDPLAQVTFSAVLGEKVQTPVTATTERAPATGKGQGITAALHTATPLADKAVEGSDSPLPATDTAQLAGNGQTQAAPASESFATALHAVKTGEPLPQLSAISQAAPVTAPSTTPALTSPAMATGTLQAEVGTPAWQQSLGQQIAVFTRNGVHHAELRLHPEELGALQISLRVNNDQAQVHFVSESHQVRSALESAIPNLRTMLEESGISLGQSSVGAETSSSAGDTTSGNTAGQGKSDPEQGDGAISLEEERPARSRIMHYSRGINTFA